MKIPVIIGLFFIVVLATVIVYYNNKFIAFEHNQNNVTILKENFQSQIDQMKLDINDSILFRDTSGHSLRLEEIVKGKRLGIYMDNYGCDMCSKEAIEYLKKKGELSIPTPFIIANSVSSNPRDLKLYNRTVPFPVYLVDVRNDKNLFSLSELHKPFYFLLDDKGIMSSIFLAKEDINLVFRDDYFLSIINKFGVMDTGGTIDVLPKDIDLGEIKLRKKYSFSFAIENNTSFNCWVMGIKSYCGCIRSEKEGKYNIESGKRDTVNASIVLTDEGQFTREIMLETNYRKAPFVVKVHGTVTGHL